SGLAAPVGTIKTGAAARVPADSAGAHFRRCGSVAATAIAGWAAAAARRLNTLYLAVPVATTVRPAAGTVWPPSCARRRGFCARADAGQTHAMAHLPAARRRASGEAGGVPGAVPASGRAATAPILAGPVPLLEPAGVAHAGFAAPTG